MKRVLVLAPHADDETLGMGATIAAFVEAGHEVHVAVVTGHGSQPHPLWSTDEFARIRREAGAATAILGVNHLHYLDLPAAMVDTMPASEVNAAIGELVDEKDPDELYVPYFHDLHGDHTAVTYAALVRTRPYLRSGRPKKIYMYETPTETHLFPGAVAPAFVPNSWVDVTDTLQKKLAAWECYASQQQQGHTPRSAAAIEALATWRGGQIGVRYSEAFLLVQELRP